MRNIIIKSFSAVFLLFFGYVFAVSLLEICGNSDKVSELIMDNEHMQELSEKSISNVGRFSIDRIGPMWDNLLAD